MAADEKEVQGISSVTGRKTAHRGVETGSAESPQFTRSTEKSKPADSSDSLQVKDHSSTFRASREKQEGEAAHQAGSDDGSSFKKAWSSSIAGYFTGEGKKSPASASPADAAGQAGEEKESTPSTPGKAGESGGEARAAAAPDAASEDSAESRTDPSAREADGKSGGGLGDGDSDWDKTLEERSNQELIDEAMETGEEVTITNGNGDEVQVSVEETGDDRYRMTVDGDSFDVSFRDAESVPADRQSDALMRLASWYSEEPAEYRENLEDVKFSDRTHKTDLGSSAAASAGDGKITFWGVGEGSDFKDPTQQLSENVFHHEMGHLAGAEIENNTDSVVESIFGFIPRNDAPVPDAWSDAVDADHDTAPRERNGQDLLSEDGKRLVTSYARGDYEVDDNYTEDFAESWKMYQEGLEDPEKMEQYRALYPNRFELLDRYFREGQD